MIYLNDEEYIKDAYKVLAWKNIEQFSLVDRPMLSYRNKGLVTGNMSQTGALVFYYLGLMDFLIGLMLLDKFHLL
ncbi:hypothetical protein B5M10_00625 [Pluralibacter gergoviae]|uniref:hypothetical protein n=1 Tax=Pluralibacter gergoviae TaxID=61647 RepID=UPI0005ECC26F|nr:hypothetical protein [Pluralibacter gergoviae]KJM55663.1 hypothetical protein SS31_24990 [Pluralibacter gergoviae]OUR04715.1 hypothetical protein B5M10_00625 [Pluralibacter gergoviae]